MSDEEDEIAEEYEYQYFFKMEGFKDGFKSGFSDGKEEGYKKVMNSLHQSAKDLNLMEPFAALCNEAGIPTPTKEECECEKCKTKKPKDD